LVITTIAVFEIVEEAGLVWVTSDDELAVGDAHVVHVSS
jgi:hypothetical protein